MSETFKASAIFFRETPEGHVQDFHNAPRRQLIFLTSGILELESSEGRRFVCRPGDLIFAEDMQGKGEKSMAHDLHLKPPRAASG